MPSHGLCTSGIAHLMSSLPTLRYSTSSRTSSHNSCEPLGRCRSHARPMPYKASTSLCTVTPLDLRCIYGASVGRSASCSRQITSLDVAPFVGWPSCYWTVTRPCQCPPQPPQDVEVEEEVEALEHYYSLSSSICFSTFAALRRSFLGRLSCYTELF